MRYVPLSQMAVNFSGSRFRYWFLHSACYNTAMTDLDPRQNFDFTSGTGTSGTSKVLLISCGALAREIIDLIEVNNWSAYDVSCLPAKWHNTPGLIVDGVRNKIHAAKNNYDKIFVVYGDCGTGGLLDKIDNLAGQRPAGNEQNLAATI